MSGLEAWSVQAINLPEHNDNPMHVDEGARAAGFPAALVAGTTVYAYMTHLPAVAWGRSWIDGGGCQVKLKAPVFDRDLVECSATEDFVVQACVTGEIKASLEIWPEAVTPTTPTGESLAAMAFNLDEPIGAYGIRAGDNLDIYAHDQIVHPAAWPVIGNRVTIPNFVTGPWIHVRSRVQHLGQAPLGSVAHAETYLLDRFQTRAGERVILDIRVSIEGRPVAAIEHESIIKLADSA